MVLLDSDEITREPAAHRIAEDSATYLLSVGLGRKKSKAGTVNGTYVVY